MCGISGQLRFDGRPVDRDLVRRMTKRLAHRGPDGEGYHFSRHVGLGHRRLAIIDVDGGQQPMVDPERSLALVANNEIYNCRELRHGLETRGRRFQTESDTEVILHLLALGGAGSVSALEGMFALAAWDAKDEALILARDRFGVKPLYYYRDAAVFIFASEMAALLEYPGVNRDLDLDAVDAYFGSLAIPEPQSVFANVHKLPAGHSLTVRHGRITLEPYWRSPLGRAGQRPRPSIAEAEARLGHELERSVAISLRSDVPIGLLLSGGLDSSSIAAVAARVSGRGYPTFTAVFREQDFDERAYARRVARQCGGRHREVLVTKSRATAIAEALAETIDEPFADASAIPTSAVCELASGHVKAVLSGEGADELLAGYPWHSTRQPRSLVTDPSAQPARAVFLPDERRALYSPSWTEALNRMRAGVVPGRSRRARPHRSPLQRSLDDDLRRYLPSDILFKSDRMSMRHSLELRVPFLNHRLAEYVMRLPDSMKVRGSERKFLLRRLMARVLPPEVLRRPKKGFSLPMDLWLWQRGRWRDLIYDTVFSRRVRERGQFDMATLERLRSEHERLDRMHGYQLWTVFMFEMWQRSFLDGAPSGHRR